VALTGWLGQRERGRGGVLRRRAAGAHGWARRGRPQAEVEVPAEGTRRKRKRRTGKKERKERKENDKRK
jgi:hypothetical protein